MEERRLSPLDRFLAGIDGAIRIATAIPTRARRPNPAAGISDSELSERDKSHAAGLMRVNHAGEIAAQALYQGHAAVARDAKTESQLRKAAAEELDHLGWCEQRLAELDAGPSKLGPIWYAGAWMMGAASGVLGDRYSLGFIEETERQVSDHLTGHLGRLPAADFRSRAIVEQMREEEEQHGADARKAGAANLPRPVRRLMKLTAGIMTRTAYWI